MPEFPVPLDNLIAHVKALRPEGGPLERLGDAVSVASRLDEQSDSLIGHFVDQARSSGASWSQIGASMGVSKQAAQKRFVLSDQGPTSAAERFSRFTPRARAALAAAGLAAENAGAETVDVAHLVAGLLTEPDGLAVKTLRRLDAGNQAIYDALRIGPADSTNLDSDPAALRALDFSEATKAALRAAVKAALELRHNYIGTEHLLVGAVSGKGPTVDALAEIDVSVALVKGALAVELAQYQLDRQRQAD
jgi:ATP-dependent Clp protease ATP-binding subunit ClpA